MTVLKVADDKQPQLDALAMLLERPDIDARTRKRIENEIWSVRTGIQGERDAAYEIDFHYASRDAYVVIHDLRLEFNGRSAQIDHLLINRVLDVWVCETKAFSRGVKFDERGEWYRYEGGFARGMASPVKQNERHVAVLEDLFAHGPIELPRRLGIRLKPSIHPVVLMSNDARIDRPRNKRAAAAQGLDTVIKVEQLVETIGRTFDERNPVGVLSHIVSAKTIEDLGRQLIALHSPVTIDVAAKFGRPPEPGSAPLTVGVAPERHARPERGTRPAGVCLSCGMDVSEKVEAYALAHPERFGGAILCYDCQRSKAKRDAAKAAMRPLGGE